MLRNKLGKGCAYSWSDIWRSPRPSLLESSLTAESCEDQSENSTMQFSAPLKHFLGKKSQLCVCTHFGQADGTLLGRHVASSRVDLWKFGNVVLLVLLSFTFWEVCPPENGYKEHFIRQNSSSPTATNPSPFLSLRLQQLYLQKNLTSSAAHWYPQTCSYWGTSPASASWLHGSLPQGQPSGCCRVGTTYWSISMCNQ